MLTKTNPDGTWGVIGTASGGIVPWKEIPAELYGALCKLRDYEKTGLNPETIEIVVHENKRLCEEIRKLNRLMDELQRIIEGAAE